MRSTTTFCRDGGGCRLSVPGSRAQWEAKTIGLSSSSPMRSFKFAWSYRLYKLRRDPAGAMPFSRRLRDPRGRRPYPRTARLFQSAGRHFNRGSAPLLALGYLGWFAGLLCDRVHRGRDRGDVARQFASEARLAVWRIAHVPAKWTPVRRKDMRNA